MKFYLGLESSSGARFFEFDLPVEVEFPIFRAIHPDDLVGTPFTEVCIFNDVEGPFSQENKKES